MSTRKAIITSHPAVPCDVCGRRLLRGEKAEAFFAGGARRNVCELCTQRAANEGWIREGLDGGTVRARPPSKRPRSFLARLRHRGEPDEAQGELASGGGETPERSDGRDEPVEHVRPRVAPRATARAGIPGVPREPRSVHAVPTNADMKMARALDLFNASSHRRTVAGVGRSLGTALVSVRPSATEGSVVTIVVGWELSWYRFEVDLGNEAVGVRIAAQGNELNELDPVDQIPNAELGDHGELHLAAAPA